MTTPTAAAPLAIFGGSFDPPHQGHLNAARSALASGAAGEVVFVPCLRHAFGKALTPFSHRMAMCRLMVADFPQLWVSDAETRIDTPGRSIALVQYFRARFPHRPLRLLVGADIYAERHLWYRFADIERLAPPLYVGREGWDIDHDHLPPPGPWSSTQIRADLAAGRPVSGVPLVVLRYIEEHQLYRRNRDG